MIKYEMLNLVIRPTLRLMNLTVNGISTEKAQALLLGTALVESNLGRVTQKGNGPALSYFQIEPFTAKDVYDRSGAKWDDLFDAIMMPGFTVLDQLATNQHLACAIARLKYYFDKQPIPDTGKGLSYYHKRIYNTELGKADPEKNIDVFEMCLEYVKEKR